MATKSNVISGMGVAMSLVQSLVAAVKKAGGSDEYIHHLVTPEADDIWEKIASTIVEACRKGDVFFDLVVDYSRSLKDSIAAGSYDWVNKDITEENFPAEKDERGKKKVTFRPFCFNFNPDIKSEEIIRKMKDEGYRPANIRELLAFGEANPELQKKFRIIALGSIWVDRNRNRYLTYLGSDPVNPGRRHLLLARHDINIDGRCRFLAVKE